MFRQSTFNTLPGNDASGSSHVNNLIAALWAIGIMCCPVAGGGSAVNTIYLVDQQDAVSTVTSNALQAAKDDAAAQGKPVTPAAAVPPGTQPLQ